MSYASGFMMGTAIIQGLRQILGGMSGQSMGGMGGGRAGFARMPGQGMSMGHSRRTEDLQLPNFPFPGMPYENSRIQPQANPLALVSSLPGRRRYCLAGLSAEQTRLLEQQLPRLSYIREAKANERTGSLLILYDAAENSRMDELMASIARIFHLAPRLPGTIAPAQAFPQEAMASAVTRSIRNAMRDFNTWLHRMTDGMLDASSLASVLLFFQGVKKLLATQQFPSASQMLWWAVSLMRGGRAA